MRILLSTLLGLGLVGSAFADSYVASELVQKRIADAIATRVPTSGHYKVSLADPSFQLALPSSAQGRWQIASLTFNPTQQNFQATLTYASDLGSAEYVSLSGSALSVVNVPTLDRDFSAGEIIASADLTTLEFPSDRMSGSLITSVESVVGQAARRTVRAHTPLFTYDVSKPVTIKKGELVTITFALPGIQLSTQGQALNNAGKGDTVSILNMSSKRTIEARVTGAGTAVVTASSSAITAAN